MNLILIIDIIFFLILNTKYSLLINPKNNNTKMMSRDHLFKSILTDYNVLNRPSSSEDDLTDITTELKLLQIDIDEKYQELVIKNCFFF
jgi:hypothetical protein